MGIILFEKGSIIRNAGKEIEILYIPGKALIISTLFFHW